MWWPDLISNLPGDQGQPTESQIDNNTSSITGVDQDNLPGPSGVSIVREDSIQEVNQIKATDDSTEKKVNDEDMEDFESDDDDLEPKEAIELFCDRVTIMGLREAYKAKIQGARIMFRIALIICSVMIIRNTYDMAIQFKNQKTIFVDSELIDRAPFPNVSICLPSFVNGTMIDRWVLPQRLLERMRKLNLTRSDIRSHIEQVLLWGFGDGFDSRQFIVTNAAFRAAADDQAKRNRSVWEILWPSCSETLSNCAFDGQPFDCCQAATIMPMLTMPCVQIRGDWIANVVKSTNRNPLRLEDTGLTFEVSTNWAMGLMSPVGAGDGYHIFIDELPSPFKIPVDVPAGMDVLLNLAQPQHVFEKTDCVPIEKAPKLKYYHDYDSHGIQCQDDAIIDVGFRHFGCTFPMLSYFPVNESCLFDAMFIGCMLLDGGAAKTTKNILPTSSLQAKGEVLSGSNSETVDRSESETHDSMRGFISKDSPCKPLCSRWSYPVFSASYGSIQYRDKDMEKSQLSDRSWSRVRVILPQSSSSHVEKPRLSGYVALCDIGGMMDAYAGFSIITYTQILAYGFYVVWCFAQKKRQRLKIRKTIQLKNVVTPSVEATFLERLHLNDLSKTGVPHN